MATLVIEVIEFTKSFTLQINNAVLRSIRIFGRGINSALVFISGKAGDEGAEGEASRLHG